MDLFVCKIICKRSSQIHKGIYYEKNKNIPLNLKDQINSRIGLICSIVVMILLVFVSINLIIRSSRSRQIRLPKKPSRRNWKQKKLPKHRRFPQLL